MKSINSIFCIFLLLLSLISGCALTDTKTGASANGTPPIIKYVQSGRVNDDEYIATSSFIRGDMVDFIITAKDLDGDIKKVNLIEYYPANTDIEHTSFKPIDLKSTSDKSKRYYSLSKPIELLGPPGERKFELQLEDGKENLSNKYTLYLFVH
jgi:hypothetical protein